MDIDTNDSDIDELDECKVPHGDNIQVLVRVRPFVPNDQNKNCCVEANDSSKCIQIHTRPHPRDFTFDHVAGIDSTQERIFQDVGKPITNACLSGYNGTIFAYGQTGSGKTFTVQGDLSDSNCEQRGLLPRVFDYLFSQIKRQCQRLGEDRVEYLVKCSCLEIYQEKIQDLFNPENINLQVRENMEHGVFVEGLTEYVVSNARECLDYVNFASRNRRVCSTSMNKESSRSHLLFTIVIECRDRTSDDGIIRTRCSRFNLVDLAGSERQRNTRTTGEHLREAGSINKSLHVLGHVMKALAEAKGSVRHIHYRDSKLTFLLKDSLGGNSLTFMIANVSPSAAHLHETLSTLQFASRAKFIKNKAQLNEGQTGSLKALQAENARLVNEVARLKERFQRGPSEIPASQFNPNDPSSRSGIPERQRIHESLSVLEQEIINIRASRDRHQEIVDLQKHLIEKKEKYNQNLKMRLKLREAECIRYRESIATQVNAPELRDAAIRRYEEEESNRRMFIEDPSVLYKNRIDLMELKDKHEQMKEYISRFVNENENNQAVFSEYEKWKSMYHTLIEENASLRKQIVQLESGDGDVIMEMSKPESVSENSSEIMANASHETRVSVPPELIEELKEKEARIAQLESSLNEVSDQMREVENERAQLTSRIHLEQQKFERERENMSNQFNDQLTQLRSGALDALNSSGRENMNLKVELAQLQGKLEAMEGELTTQQSCLRDLRMENETKTRELKDKDHQIQVLCEKLDTSQSEMSHANHTLEQMQTQYTNYQREFDEFKRMHDREHDEFIAMRDRHANIESKLDRLGAEKSEIEEQLAQKVLDFQSLEEEHQILNDVHNTITSEKFELEELVKKTQEEIGCLQRVISNGRMELEERNNSIEKLQSQLSQSISNRDEQVQHLIANKLELEETVSNMKEDITRLETTLNESNEKFARGEQSFRKLQEEDAELRSKLEDYKNAYGDIETKLKEQTRMKKDLMGELEQVQARCESYNAQLVEQDLELQRTRGEHEELLARSRDMENVSQQQIKVLGQQLIAAQDKIEEAKKRLNEQNEVFHNREAQMHQELQNLTERAHMDHDQGVRRIEELTNELQNEKQNHENSRREASHEINELRNTVQTTKMEFEKINQRLLQTQGDLKLAKNQLKDREKQFSETQSALLRKEQLLEFTQSQLQSLGFGSDGISTKQHEGNLQSVLSEVETKLNKFHQEKFGLQDENRRLSEEIHTSHQQISNLRNDNSQLQHQMNEQQRKMHEQETNFKQMLVQIQKESEKVEQKHQLQLDRSSQIIQSYEKRVEIRDQQLSSARARNDELVAEMNRMKSTESEKSNLVSVNIQLERDLTEMKRMVGKLRNEYTVLEDTHRRQNERVSELEQKLFGVDTKISKCMHERRKAIETAKRMRQAEDKAYDEMLMWKSKYNELSETESRGRKLLEELQHRVTDLETENSKLAGHQNPQQRINHLMTIKRENDSLKRENRQLQRELVKYERKLGKENKAPSRSGSPDQTLEKELNRMTRTKDEAVNHLSSVLSGLQSLCSAHFEGHTLNPSNVDEHVAFVQHLSRFIEEKKLQVRNCARMEHDLSIRDEQIKFLEDQIRLGVSNVMSSPGGDSLLNGSILSDTSMTSPGGGQSMGGHLNQSLARTQRRFTPTFVSKTLT